MKSNPKSDPVFPVRLEHELAQFSPDGGFHTRFKHSVNLGDLIAAMATMKRYHAVTGRKVIVSQSISTLAQYYPGAVHPTVDEDGRQVCMNNKMWEMVKPLIESQEYIHSFEKYNGQKVDIDLDVVRGKTFVNMPHGMIQGWIPLAFPDLAFDISKSWITLNGKCPPKIKKQVQGKIIINFTERYRNQIIDYFFLKKYMTDLVFSGTEREHWLFCNQWQLSIPNLQIENFLDLGYALKECKFMLGNQSMCWNLAEALKTPRILELCNYAQNCMPMIGEYSYGFFHQVGAEYYVKVLDNVTAKK